MFKPETLVFNTPIRIQLGIDTPVNGAADIRYVDIENPIDYCNFKGKGGTERVESGMLLIEDTALITMWYRPDINKQCRVLVEDDPKQAFKIIGEEDIEKRGLYLILKVRRMVT